MRSVAGRLGFFAVVGILIASLDTGCNFFNIFVYWIGLAWTTRFLTLEVVHFSSCHVQIQACCCLQNRKAREVLFHSNFIERGLFLSVF